MNTTMMNLKNTLNRAFTALTFGALLIGGAATASAAQPHAAQRAHAPKQQTFKPQAAPSKHAQDARQERQQMIRKLNLSARQQRQLQTMKDQHKVKRAAILRRHRNDKQAAAPELKALKQQSKRRFIATLNPAQRRKLEQLQRERQHDHRDYSPRAQAPTRHNTPAPSAPRNRR